MKENKKLIKKRNAKVLQLFRQDFIDLLKKRRFNGKLMIEWREGNLTYCRLSTNLEFRVSRNRDEGEEFWFDGMW